MGELPGTGADERITHGICEECLNEASIKSPRKLRELLERLNAPVVITDQNAMIVAVNDEAASIIGRPTTEIEGFLCGDVIGCVNPTTEKECGETEECDDCDLRNLIENTYKTGETKNDVRAFATVLEFGVRRKVYFLISAEKLGDVVLLRIDENGQASQTSPR
jgi:PAS domain-containing protein